MISPGHSSGRRAGFTLVELLVVISVLGILSSLFLPAIGRSKALASRAQCMNNLRQIGSAVRLYAMDHQGRVPTFASEQPFWRTGLHPFLGLPPQPTKSDRIFICPKDPAWFGYPYSSHGFSSYQYNGYHTGAGEPRLWWNLDGASDPGRAVLNAEAGAKLQYFSFHEPRAGFGLKPPSSWQTEPKNVFLFTDGHAAYLKTFHDWTAGVPAGYLNADFWSPEPPPEFGYTWNVD
jgi:prepilin-type N-terminal cleavage/methylation domain-containing protein